MKKNLTLTICLLLAYLVSFAGKFVFIPVSETQNLETLFKNNDLKIHYYCDDYVLATATEVNLLDNVVILDEKAFADVSSYFIVYCFDDHKEAYLQTAAKNAHNLYSGEHFFIMKTLSGALEPAKNDGMVAIMNTEAKLPKLIADYPVITEPDLNIINLMYEVETETVMGYIQHLEDFVTRRHNHANAILAQNWIKDKYEELGLEVELHTFASSPSKNVIAIQHGTEFPDEYIVLGGHYDSYTFQGGAEPGADDDASGVAGVMETARILSQYDFKRSIIYCAFTAEEVGLYGSNAYASRCQQQGMNILGYFNLDMIGYLRPGDPIHFSLVSPSSALPLADYFVNISEIYFPTVTITKHLNLSGGDSDHTSFNQKGYMGVWPFENINYMSPHIHSANDLIGPSVNNPEQVAVFTQAVVASVATLAEIAYIIPEEGPYIINNGYTVVGEDLLTYTSTNSEIEVTLKNIGVDPSNALSATIACADPQITINSGPATCTSIASGETATVKFNVTVANDILDGKFFFADVNVTEEGTEGAWESRLTLKGFAPKFSLEKVLINGIEGGPLKAGAIVTLKTIVANKGGADAFNVTGNLEINSPYVVLACSEAKRGAQNLPAGETIELLFILITDPEMPYEHTANFKLLLNAQYERDATIPFTASGTGSGNYCSSGTQNCSLNDRFTLVQLYKTSDPTNFLINNPHSTCSSNSGYEDFTNTIIELEPGAQYNIKVNVSNGGLQHIGGWFDLNGNNTFDANEKLIAFTCPSGGTNNQTFTIPADNFVPGVYRFRLVCKWNSAPTANGCDNTSYGQTHDYTIVIPELYPRVQNVEAELEGFVITVTWEPPATELTPDGYNIYRNGLKLNSTWLTETSFVEENITEGIYAYGVTAVYTGNKESFAEMSNVICFLPVLCEEPVNLNGVAEETTAIITWNEPEMDGMLLNYNIYRDEEKIGETLPQIREYQDKDLAVGTYVYQVSASYEHCEESDLTEGVAVEIGLGIKRFTNDVFIVPNPAHNTITITAGTNFHTVEIVNLLGQTILSQSQVGNKAIVDISRLNNGVYFVRIISENGLSVKKFIKL